MADPLVSAEELLRIFQDSDERDYDSDIEIEKNHPASDEEDCIERDDTEVEEESEEEPENVEGVPTEIVPTGVQTELTYSTKVGLFWKSIPPNQSNNRLENIVDFVSGFTDSSNYFLTMKDAFNLFISENMLNYICNETNRQCERDNFNRIRKKDIAPLLRIELEAFIGILLSSGKLNGRKIQFKELWTRNELYKQYFYSAAMSRDRFLEIYSVLRFDDRLTREHRERVNENKMEAIKVVIDRFAKSCRENYNPGTHITIDERLAVYNGKCKFRVFMKNKPGHYGIKVYTAADSETAYTVNLQLYTGKSENGQDINQGERVVMDLLQPYYGSGRGVTTDNFFTSVSLAKKLLDKKLTITGTLRKNKTGIPRKFLKSKNREEFSSIFAFTDDLTLVSYAPKPGRSVALLSTEFRDNELSGGVKKQPEIVVHYSQTKAAINATDKMTRQYSCVRPTNRWPFRIFMELIDIAALNAFILWQKKFPDWKKSERSRRKVFIQELAYQLVQNNVKVRKEQRKNFNKMEKVGFEMFSKGNETCELLIEIDQRNISPSLRKRARCYLCPRNSDKKTYFHCCSCKKHICATHRIEKKNMYCKECC